MLKYLFAPRYSFYESIALFIIALLALIFSFWYILLVLPGVIIQIVMTHKIQKQEFNEQEMKE